MAEPASCPNCGELIHAVAGRCPNCWFALRPELLPAENPYSPPLLDDDDGDGPRTILLAPGLVVALVGVAVGSRVVLIVGVVVMGIGALLIRGLWGRL